MKVTIRDVAKAAGVSAMAVSSVLHGTGRNVRVSAETADKIRGTAADLNYQPNTLARSLRTRKTGMVGVVCQQLDRLSERNPYYPQLLNGIMAALFPADYTLALCPTLLQSERDPAIADGRFDGVLWARPDFTHASVEMFHNSRVPVVMMHAPPGSAPGIPTFIADNDDAMRIVVDHLVSLGHKDITFVIDEMNQDMAEGRYRAEAFMRAVSEAKLEGDVWVWDERMRTLEKRLSQFKHKTAIATFSDTLAGHMLVLLNELGVSVPRDLSVVGFDSSSFCERTPPRLTSIHQPVEKMAFEATNHLLTIIRGSEFDADPATVTSTLYSCSLDVRESTARPASSKLKIIHEKP